MPSFARARLVPGLLLLCLAATPCPSFSQEDAAVQASQAPAPAPAPSVVAPAAPASVPSADAAPAPAPDPAAAPSRAPEQLSDGERTRKAAEAGSVRAFTPSVALVRPLVCETDLPSMMISLGMVSFVGEIDPVYPEEDAYAILPLSHDAVLEVYDLHWDGQELTQLEEPSVVRRMGANEAYVVRVPSFAGVPARGICISSRGRRNCWNPGEDGFNGGFLRWSKTKGMR